MCRLSGLNKWNRLLAAGSLLFAVWASATEPQPEETIELGLGASRTLSFTADIGSAFVGQPAVADVVVHDNRTLVLIAQSPGITTLRIHDSTGELLADYSVHVSVESSYARTVVSRIAGEDAPIDVEPVGNALFVSGRAKSPSQAERILSGIRAVSGETVVVDSIGLEGAAQVNLEVLISEVSRNVSQTLGIDWSLDLNPFENPLRTWITGSGVRAGTGALQLANILNQDVAFYALGPDGQPAGEPQFVNQVQELAVVNPIRGGDGGIVLSHTEIVGTGKYRATTFLEALAENGLAVVHARPNLTTVSGQPAEFFAGLEVPVPTITDRGTIGTEYRQTGVSLRFTPTVLDENQISLFVEPRIRELAAGGATIAGTIVPNVTERSASTTVELADGESIAIAGLFRRNSTSSNAGVPLLKDIPLWGALFRSTAERDQSVELILVVTPRIVAGTPAERQQANTIDAPSESALQFSNEFYY